MLKKIISFLTTIAISVSLISVNAFAASDNSKANKSGLAISNTANGLEGYADKNSENYKTFNVNIEAKSGFARVPLSAERSADIVILLDRSQTMGDGSDYVLLTGEPDKTKNYYRKHTLGSMVYYDKLYWYQKTETYGFWTYNDKYIISPDKYPFYEKTESNLELVKKSAKEYINLVSEISPDSNISIVSFAYENYKSANPNNQKICDTITVHTPLSSTDNTDNLYTAVDSVKEDGATDYVTAYKTALQILKNSNSDNQRKHIVLFSDGLPSVLTYGDPLAEYVQYPTEEWLQSAKTSYQNAKKDIDKLKKDNKDMDLETYAVQVVADNDKISAETRNQAEGFMKSVASRNANFVKLERSSDLGEIAKAVAKTYRNYRVLNVRHYIDPRFDLVNGNKEIVEVGGTFNATDKNGNLIEGKLLNDENGNYALFDSQKITAYSNKNGNEKGQKWNVNFNIKAKETTVGENIDTNLNSNSGLYNKNSLVKTNNQATVDIPEDVVVIDPVDPPLNPPTIPTVPTDPTTPQDPSETIEDEETPLAPPQGNNNQGDNNKPLVKPSDKTSSEEIIDEDTPLSSPKTQDSSKTELEFIGLILAIATGALTVGLKKNKKGEN